MTWFWYTSLYVQMINITYAIKFLYSNQMRFFMGWTVVNIENMNKWLQNKDVRIWKRIMLLLCEVGSRMSTYNISHSLGIRSTSARRTLLKLRVDHQVHNEKKDKKELWRITKPGVKRVRSMQKKGLLPERDR